MVKKHLPILQEKIIKKDITCDYFLNEVMELESTILSPKEKNF